MTDRNFLGEMRLVKKTEVEYFNETQYLPFRQVKVFQFLIYVYQKNILFFKNKNGNEKKFIKNYYLSTR